MGKLVWLNILSWSIWGRGRRAHWQCPSFQSFGKTGIIKQIEGAIFRTRLLLGWTFILKSDVVIAETSLTFCVIVDSFDGMWKVAMSEEVGKALQSVVERVNQAAARRPKVTAAREASAKQPRCRLSTVVALISRAATARLVM